MKTILLTLSSLILSGCSQYTAIPSSASLSKDGKTIVIPCDCEDNCKTFVIKKLSFPASLPLSN